MQYKFRSKDGALLEADLILLPAKHCGRDFESQFKNLLEQLSDFTRHGQEGSSLVFLRLWLSDLRNQLPIVEELLSLSSNVSVIQQAPLCGAKVAAWAHFSAHDFLEWRSHRVEQPLAEGAFGQTTALFEGLRGSLGLRGGSVGEDCLRTWLYVDDIDTNYADMVRARNEVFDLEGLRPDTHYIASTGIEGRAGAPGVKVAMDSVCLSGKCPASVRYLRVPEYMNDTAEYGVRFERGARVTLDTHSIVFVSGTASIDPHGEILHPGDVLAQASRMLENIGAVLEAAGARWSDVGQMTVYLRDITDAGPVSEFLSSRFPDIPLVIVQAPVCRPGWLIEAECLAYLN
ncbi:MAG: hypothetical protein HUJ89_01515 [Bacteroidales bacterium]|nr:hypothetical protein [Bacteroidales bacterium]